MSTGEVSVVHKGNELEVEWKMPFASLSEKVGTRYQSPGFSFEDESWDMVMYPNGHHQIESIGFFDLFLCRCSFIGPAMNVEFSFAFKTLNGRKEFKRQTTGVFEKYLLGYSFHDIRRFLHRSDFERRRSEFLSHSGHLTVVCTLKRLDSAGSASNVTTADCSYCEKAFDVQEISSHERKCRVKCPECSAVILLQNWDGHECQRSRSEAATNTTESFLICQHDKILQDFKQLLLKQENCDVVLTVKGREFHAHKSILAARSPVFASTFRNDMKEKETGIVDIEDCDPSVFPDFLCFLYSDEVDNLSQENVFGLFTAADKYDISDLRGKCLQFMKENLSVDTFCETLTIALRHCEAELIRFATDFFIRNARKILVTVKWQTFAAENPIQSNELLIKFAELAVVPNT